MYDNLSRHNENIFFGNAIGNGKLKLIKADILDARKLNAAFKNVDVVYHCAAKVLTPFANQDPHFFEQINHWGTSEIIEAAEKNNIQHLIYLSSASVYDRIAEPATEQTIPNPNTYYGISKLRGEEHIQRLNGMALTHIIRCGNVYGYSNSMRFDAVINNFMLQANFENKISIHGTGAQTRAFIHINNTVEALAQLPFKQVPLRVIKTAMKAIPILKEMVTIGNPNSITDAGVGALCIAAAVEGAGMNVRINAKGLKDAVLAEKLKIETLELINETKANVAEIIKIVELELK